jgi:hypothetical protein
MVGRAKDNLLLLTLRVFNRSNVFGEAVLKLEPKHVQNVLDHGCSGDRTAFKIACLAFLTILSVSESQPLAGKGSR